MGAELLHKIMSPSGEPALAVLIDPDKYNPEVASMAEACAVSCIFIGGSRLHKGDLEETVRSVKSLTRLPVILFPGDEHQLTPFADGVMLPWLVSGRNAAYLIGKQVLMAPKIKQMQLPCFSVGYVLINGDHASETQRVTGTEPIPSTDIETVINTCLAAELMGLSAIYLEAGSGASTQVNADLIIAVKRRITVPLIIGGGIDSVGKAASAVASGAQIVVVGNAIEKDVNLLPELTRVFRRKQV
jgi:phosphoglycerol geranylgeranyltransferase